MTISMSTRKPSGASRIISRISRKFTQNMENKLAKQEVSVSMLTDILQVHAVVGYASRLVDIVDSWWSWTQCL